MSVELSAADKICVVDNPLCVACDFRRSRFISCDAFDFANASVTLSKYNSC